MQGQPAEAVMGRGWGWVGGPKGRETVDCPWWCGELRWAWREGVVQRACGRAEGPRLTGAPSRAEESRE